MFKHPLSGLCLLLLLLLGMPGWSQEKVEPAGASVASLDQAKTQLDVHWLYGAYVPRYAPVVSLTNDQRLALFERQTFSTRGIYIKSGFLSLIDQAKGTPYEWGGGFGGCGHRLISNYAQSSIQNLFSAAANAALRYEPLV